MRVARWRGFLLTIAVTLGSIGTAEADLTIERSASILVFPKVIADGTRDTIIRIVNTSNQVVRAHCFYVNAALTDPTRPPGPLNPPLWIEVDFSITLTRQQPTQWQVSEGRIVDPSDMPETEFSGFDPGRIPPVVPDFRGELKCVEVDDSGAPLAGNHLLGTATLGFTAPGRPLGEGIELDGIAEYNAIGVLGEENNGDDVLVLGGGQCRESGAICNSDEDCGDAGPCVFEYNACPETWILNHLADFAPDITLEEGNFTRTELTVVPCTENFETQIPTTVTLQFLSTNEFESQFSVSTSVTCWANFFLADVGATALTIDGQLPDPQGTMYLQTRMRSAAGTPLGVMMVAEEYHVSRVSDLGITETRFASSALVNLHREGERRTPDIITIPADQLVP